MAFLLLLGVVQSATPAREGVEVLLADTKLVTFKGRHDQDHAHDFSEGEPPNEVVTVSYRSKGYDSKEWQVAKLLEGDNWKQVLRYTQHGEREAGVVPQYKWLNQAKWHEYCRQLYQHAGPSQMLPHINEVDM
jgi:hypothetical protein